ncbi:hypothetical protein ACQEU6_02185 [Spirillospora sp. CA-108201]
MRWVRSATFAAACAVVAALGHTAGGGRFDGSAMLAGYLLVLVPTLALTGRERTLATILPATAISQVVMHVLLMRGGGNLAMSVDAPALRGSMAGMGADGGMHHEGPFPGAGMLLMHVVSVLVTSAWLGWGESRLCSLVRLLANWILRPLTVPLMVAPVLPCGRPVLNSVAEDLLSAQTVLRYAVARRGPPEARAASGAVA